MALFNAVPSKLGFIVGKYVFSGSCTDVYGGTLTAGATTAANNSALLTWSPAFISAPVLVAVINSGPGTTTSPCVRFTGVGVSNAYIQLAAGASPISGVTVGIMAVGEQRL